MTPSKGTYLRTYAALLALTALTFGLSFAGLGAWGIVLALAIAAAKGALVALFFMHLVEQRAVNALAFGTSLLLLALLLGLAAADVATRERGAAPSLSSLPSREAAAARAP